ncbi:hypothetical protein BJV74DRAFT_301098 [Russula compacta]|nr:hypothetical protein BJV74DRAFT_301098 [Russula compacta]
MVIRKVLLPWERLRCAALFLCIQLVFGSKLTSFPEKTQLKQSHYLPPIWEGCLSAAGHNLRSVMAWIPRARESRSLSPSIYSMRSNFASFTSLVARNGCCRPHSPSQVHTLKTHLYPV